MATSEQLLRDVHRATANVHRPWLPILEQAQASYEIYRSRHLLGTDLCALEERALLLTDNSYQGLRSIVGWTMSDKELVAHHLDCERRASARTTGPARHDTHRRVL